MAAITSAQHRRRPATYGKTSSKRVHSYGHKATLPTSQGFDSGNWNDEPVSDRSGGEASMSAIQVHSGAILSKGRLDQKSSSGTATQSRLYTSKNRAHKVRSEALRTSQTPTVNATAVFDIPSSSDDETFTPSIALKYPSRKFNGLSGRGRSVVHSLGAQISGNRSIDKIQDKLIKSDTRTQTMNRGASNGTVFDDGALRQHIATEDSLFHYASQLRSKNIIKRGTAQFSGTAQNAETTKGLTHNLEISNPVKRPSQTFPLETSHSESLNLGRCGRRAQQSIETIPKKRRRLAENQEHRYKGVSAPAALQSMLPEEESALQDHSKCHPTLPSPSQSCNLPAHTRHKTISSPVTGSHTSQIMSNPAKGTATPQQVRMWDELLNDGLLHNSPSHLKLKQLSISEYESSGLGLKGAMKKCSAAAATCSRQQRPAQRPRRRLIDAISSDHTDSHPRRELSVEESDDSAAESRESLTRSLSLGNNDQADTSALGGSETATLDLLSDGNSATSLLPPVTQQGGPRRTYARQRSHLTEDILQGDELFQAPLDLGPYSRLSNRRRAAGGALPKLKTPQIEEDGNHIADDSTNGAIRSIHELREAGGNKRFLDSMDAIFEDIEARQPSNISRRRSSLMEMSSKLSDKSFSLRFLEHGLDRRLFVKLAYERDTIIGFLLASAILFVISNGVPIRMFSHLRTHGVTQLIVRLLEAEQDISIIARQRQSNMSKISQNLLSEVRELLQHPTFWGAKQPSEVSPRTIALKCLETIVRQSRGCGAALDFLSQEAVEKLVQLLKSCATSTSESGRSPMQAIELVNSLSILELGTANGNIEEAHWTPRILASLSETLSGICSGQEDWSRHIQTVALRLTINLTNNNATLCDVFATSTFIGANVGIITRNFDSLSAIKEEEDRLLAVDQLILALGSLINFAEWSDISRLILIEPHDSGTTLLDELLGLFRKGAEKALLADSMAETHSNVAFGYLSVLLGNACQNPTAKAYTCSKLYGSTLSTLIAAVEEFLEYHKKVDAELYDADDGTDLQAGFTDRLQSVLDRLKASGV
ncbi:MAG: hypothetical protein M1835_004566 [Candelina submexicana]|nr:MAG: hypothetical protein M1835_004566 [Candelina submexicana]